MYVVSFFDVTEFILNFAFFTFYRKFILLHQNKGIVLQIFYVLQIFFFHRMDMKGKRSDAIFPDLIFTIDNFEEVRTTETKFIFNITN